MAFTATQVRPEHRGAAAATAQREQARHVAASDAVRVALQRQAGGVLLEIEEGRSIGPRIVVVTSFTQASSLEDWCADDPLRFEEPIVHQQVRRHAEELWRSDP
jgi:hypothetical protein